MNYERDHVVISYDDRGTGPAVVLVHGFPLCRQMWSPQVSALAAAGFRIITPDLRGFGGSCAPANDYSIDSFADDIINLLDHLKINKAVIGGMSMGGYVLLNLLERYPQRILAPCFIVTRSGADDEAGKAKRLAMAADVTTFGAGIVADVFAKLLFADATVQEKPELVRQVLNWMETTSPAALAGGLVAMSNRKDLTPLLQQINGPALVIGATGDRAMPRENFDIFMSGLPHASGCLIDNAGHMVNIEQSEIFNDCLLKFLLGLKLEP